MRILIGWLLLISVAALAGLIQSRWTDGVRAERDALMRARGARTAPTDEWSRVIVGRPSGAEAADVEIAPPPAFDDPSQDDVQGPQDPPELPPLPVDPEPRVWQVTIQPGMVLSKLCSEAYGRGTPEIASAVARYNGLANPDRLKLGQKILLPPFEDLRTEAGAPLTPPR